VHANRKFTAMIADRKKILDFMLGYYRKITDYFYLKNGLESLSCFHSLLHWPKIRNPLRVKLLAGRRMSNNLGKSHNLCLPCCSGFSRRARVGRQLNKISIVATSDSGLETGIYYEQILKKSTYYFWSRTRAI